MFLPAAQLLFLTVLAAVGFVSESLVFGVAVVAAFGTGLWMNYRLGHGLTRRRVDLLAFALLVGAFVYVKLAGEPMVILLRHWLTGMLIVRAFQRLAKRDYVFCILIATALFVHVSNAYTGLPFLFLFLALLVLVPQALFEFQARFGTFQTVNDVDIVPAAPAGFGRGVVSRLAWVSVLLLLLTVALFLVLPRPRERSFMGGMIVRRDPVTGLGDSVPLGTFNRVVEKRDLVMTVETDRPTFWRASVFDYYDKGTWQETARYEWRRPTQVSPVRPGQPETVRRFEIFDVRLTGFKLLSAGTVVSAREENRLWRIWINDLYCTLFVSASEARQVHGRYELVSQDGEYVGFPELGRTRWRLPNRQVVNESDLYRMVPEDLPERVRRLAADLTSGGSTQEEKVDAVLRHLQTGFTYSREDLGSGTRNPLENFLFETRRGHCEYHATAMAILLRCAGIHARVVQGFVAGTYMDGVYVVRLSDAHLWTEVFYPGRGWKSYDPTPQSVAEERAALGIGWLEKLSIKWHTYVIRYDRAAQTDLFGWVRSGVLKAAGVAQQAAPGLGRWAAGLAGVAIVLWGLIRIRLWRGGWMRVLSQSRRARGPARANRYFQDYLDALARRGYRRRPGTTPNDLLAALNRDCVRIVPEARWLTQVFYEVRFGGGEITPETLSETERALDRVKKWARETR
jgi:transglutaminase-like putative cysteine protease